MQKIFELIAGFCSKHIGTDGLLHFVVSAIIVAVLKLFLPTFVACAIAFVIGTLKEVYDNEKETPTGFSIKDLLCDLAGIIVGGL